MKMNYIEQEDFDISYDELLKIIPNKYKLAMVIARRLQQLLDYQVRKDPGAKINKKKLLCQIYEELRDDKLIIDYLNE